MDALETISPLIEGLCYLGILWGAMTVWNKVAKRRLERRLLKLSSQRSNGFDAFWALSSKESPKEIAQYLYGAIKRILKVLGCHPDFPLQPNDDLVKDLEFDSDYIELFFYDAYDEFVHAEVDELSWKCNLQKLRSLTVDDLLQKISEELRTKA